MISRHKLGTSLSASGIMLLEDFARNSGGVFTHVKDATDLRSAMGSYYNFPRLVRESNDVVVTPPYFDFFGLGVVVTLAKKVYDPNDPGRLLGVAALDLTLADLLGRRFELNVAGGDLRQLLFQAAEAASRKVACDPSGRSRREELARLKTEVLNFGAACGELRDHGKLPRFGRAALGCVGAA